MRAGWPTSTRTRLACAAAVVAVSAAAVVLLGPAVARAVESQVLRALAGGISGSVTYKETNGGRDRGQQTLGVVGQGTISGKLTLDAKVAAAVAGALSGVPLTALSKGGTYVTRYDIDAKNGHKGLVVIRFASPGLGSLCLSFDVTYGKFVPNKMSYIPSTTTYQTVGGTGGAAKLHGSGRVTQGEVTGSSLEQILAHGAPPSVSVGPAAPPSAACVAVAKLAR